MVTDPCLFALSLSSRPVCPTTTTTAAQVFPFSSTRKRMSSLVATGPPVSTPGTGGGGQPARLYVKGAAELLLDSCRLQVCGC